MTANIIAEVMQRIRDHYRDTHFQATVVTYTAGPPATATVQRNGQPSADPSQYRVLVHVGTLTPGQVVFLCDSTGNGTPVVVGRLA